MLLFEFLSKSIIKSSEKTYLMKSLKKLVFEKITYCD